MTIDSSDHHDLWRVSLVHVLIATLEAHELQRRTVMGVFFKERKDKYFDSNTSDILIRSEQNSVLVISEDELYSWNKKRMNIKHNVCQVLIWKDVIRKSHGSHRCIRILYLYGIPMIISQLPISPCMQSNDVLTWSCCHFLLQSYPAVEINRAVTMFEYDRHIHYFHECNVILLPSHIRRNLMRFVVNGFKAFSYRG